VAGALPVDGRMSGEQTQKRRCVAGDCSARLLRQFARRRWPASHLFSPFTSQQQSSILQAPRSKAPAPVQTPQHPAFLRCCCCPLLVFPGNEERPLTTSSWCLSASQAHPGPLSYLSSPALRCHAPIHKAPTTDDRRPLSLTLRTQLHLLCARLSPLPALSPAVLAPLCSVSGILRSLQGPWIACLARSARFATLPPTVW
jgi:hypothetical protein